MEHLHNLIAVDAWLKESLVVLFLKVGKFFAHHTEVFEKTLLAHLVLARYVGLTERHQIVDVVTGVTHQTAHGTVGHHLVGYHDGAHVQIDQTLHVLHLGIERQHETAEHRRHHFCTYYIMIMERPSRDGVPPLGTCLANIVHQRGPTQPQVVGTPAHIVEHFESMVEIVLVTTVVAHLHYVERCQFGQDKIEQSAALQINKAATGRRRHHNLVEFVLDALSADNLYTVGIAFEGRKSLVLNVEVELCGKTYAAQHAQRVVGKGDIGVERRADDAVLEIVDAVERVNQLTETVAVETHGHGIDGEVAAVLIVFKRAVLYHRLARVVAVALAARPDKLHLDVTELHLCRAEIAKHRQPRLTSEHLLQFGGHADAAANHNHIYIV